MLRVGGAIGQAEREAKLEHHREGIAMTARASGEAIYSLSNVQRGK